MDTFLKQQGYKPTKKETLNNREFRHVSDSFTISEEESTFDNAVYVKTQVWDLFLSERFYTDEKVEALLIATREKRLDVSASVETMENGRLISFTVENT